MQAPSEKHLEDYIAEMGMPEIYSPVPTFDVLIGRQVQLPEGVIDLLYTNESSISVVELKKAALDDSALRQVLRYQSQLTSIWEFYTDTRPPVNSDPVFPYGASPIRAALIGYSIDRHTLLACHAVGIDVWLYRYAESDTEYWYDFDWQCQSLIDPNCIYEMTHLKQAMLKIYLSRLAEAGKDITALNIRGGHNE